MTHGSLDRFAVDLNTVLSGIRSGGILIGRGIVDIFPVMRQIAERKDKRGGHRIIGWVAEGVLSRDLTCIGEEFFGTVVVILRELPHIKGQKLLIHRKRTVLFFYKCAGAVCSAPVTLSGVGMSRLNKYGTEQQNRKNRCNCLPFHLYRPPLLSTRRQLYITFRYL